MTKEELKRFCGEGVAFNRPWSFCIHSYACDGYILIQVPRLDDVEENPQAPNLNEILTTPKPTMYFPLKGLELPGPIPCPECEGKARNVECPECYGTGEVEFDTNYNSYSVECQNCHGEGKVDVCAKCKGTGKEESKRPIDIGNAAFQPKYLKLLQSLPGCEIGPTGPMEPAWFKFDGGDGLLMPMRK